MNARKKAVFRSAVLGSMMLSATAVYADQDEGPGACGLLPSHAVLKAALIAVCAAGPGALMFGMLPPVSRWAALSAALSWFATA